MAAADSRWLRKASELEVMFEIGHQKKVNLLCYTLQLSSVIPIYEDILRDALHHLYRQVPVLRVCLQKRNDELWLKEMEQCEVDLKVIIDGDLKQEQEKLTNHTYASEKGPLWCVRFLLISRDTPTDQNQPNEKDFLHYYALLFGIHHSVADGTTNVKICNLLITTLDDLLNGKNIDDEHQLGELTGDAEISSLYEQEIVKLRNDPKLYHEMEKELDEVASTRPLIRNICDIPSDIFVKTENVEVTFDRDISEHLYRKVKSQGISIHSAVVGILNLALVKLLQDSGLVQKEYDIRAFHVTDMRRYYQGDTSRVLGFHGPLVRYSAPFVTQQDMLPVFWEIVSEFHRKFHSDLSNKNVLTRGAFRKMTDDKQMNLSKLLNSDGDPNSYYSISNIGNLSGKLTEGGNYVRVNKLTRFVSLMNRRSIMSVLVHSFRNQLNINFTYSTRYLTHEFVFRLKESFHTYMVAVCEI